MNRKEGRNSLKAYYHFR